MKSKKRSKDQINRIRDHLKRMISSPLHTNDVNMTNEISSDNLNIINRSRSNEISSDNLNIINRSRSNEILSNKLNNTNTLGSINTLNNVNMSRSIDTLSNINMSGSIDTLNNINMSGSNVVKPAIESHASINNFSTQMNKPLLIDPMTKNPDMFNKLKLKTTYNKKVVSSNGRLCKVRKYNHKTLLQHLKQRKDTFSHLIKPDLSYGQMICLAILQSPEEKLILSQICEWISTSFPFFQLTDMDWQNCIRHTLSINPSFIKLESIKISKIVDNKTKFVFINKDKSSPNKNTKNFRKSSRWGVIPTGVLTFFDYEDDGFESFKTSVKQINQFLPDMNELTFIPMFPHEQYTKNNNSSVNQQQQQQQHQFQNQSPHDIKDGSNSSSPLSIMSNNPATTSSISSTSTDLSAMNHTTLMAPSIIISNSPPVIDPKVKEDSEIIYDIDAKLDLLKTPKFDTSPIRKYFLNNIDTKLEGNINDHFQVNRLNTNIFSPDHLNLGSPSHLPIHSILNTFDDRNFVFHL
ncbi:hypothetical protein MOSE0_E00958 [Monosporozyma servazzii]